MTEWRVYFSPHAEKQFAKLDPQTQRLIRDFLRHRVLASGDPLQFGKSLTGSLSGIWRYRVGKYRILCDVQRQEMTIEVITIAKRDTVYTR
jgi:mRNA interferase RelE/StbE